MLCKHDWGKGALRTEMEGDCGELGTRVRLRHGIVGQAWRREEEKRREEKLRRDVAWSGVGR